MKRTLKRLEDLYNCQFYHSETEDYKFLELETLDRITPENKRHIDHCLKNLGYKPYMYEGLGDYLILLYIKEN